MGAPRILSRDLWQESGRFPLLWTSELITWEVGVMKPVHQEAGDSVLQVKAPGQILVVRRALLKGRNKVSMSSSEFSWINVTKYSPLSDTY